MIKIRMFLLERLKFFMLVGGLAGLGHTAYTWSQIAETLGYRLPLPFM